MENQPGQDDFYSSLKSEFGDPDWHGEVFEVSRKCNNAKNGGRKVCPVTGVRCKIVNNCESAIETRSFDQYHGDSTMGE